MYSFLHFLFSGVPIKECVGLLPKMYSITYDITEMDNNVLKKEKKVAKGISKCEIKKTLQNAMYKNCLFGGNYYNKFNEMDPKCKSRTLREHYKQKRPM